MRSLFVVSAFFLLSSSVFACESLSECLKLEGELTGKTYLFQDDLNKKLPKPYPELTKENASLIVSNLLQLHGHARVMATKELWKVIPASDIRYHPVDVFKSQDLGLENFPKDADYHMMSHQLKNPKLGDEITRAIRPFLSRYGRIVEVAASGEIIVQDTGLNLARIYGLIIEADRAPSSEQMERIEKRDNFRKKRQGQRH